MPSSSDGMHRTFGECWIQMRESLKFIVLSLLDPVHGIIFIQVAVVPFNIY